jgi:transcriptional regulator with XRE-family HTH domain
MKVGNKIREIRKEKGLTQKELGKRLGVSDMSVSRYENAENMQLETLKKVAAALEVPIGAFIVSSKNNPPKNAHQNKLSNDDSMELLTIYFDHLNTEGKKRLFEYLQDLVKIPEYRIDEKENSEN